MRIIWLGSHHLHIPLADMPDVELRRVPLHCDEALEYAQIVERAGMEPELLVYADQSQPPPLLGLQHYPCATLFYCVDSHIHRWYPFYAQAFDLCAVSLRDHLAWFRLRLSDTRLRWLPPTAKPGDAPLDCPRTTELLFVGTVNPETTPIRHEFLSQLGERLPGLRVCQGKYPQLYPTAEVVLNIAERGDLNFRVFEALGCGACLLTPQVGHGLTELFVDGEALCSYAPQDMDALLRQYERIMADAELRQRLRDNGLAAVNARHRPEHRAAELLQWLRGHDLRELVRSRKAVTRSLTQLLQPIYLLWAESLRNSPLAELYLRASRPEGLRPKAKPYRPLPVSARKDRNGVVAPAAGLAGWPPAQPGTQTQGHAPAAG